MLRPSFSLARTRESSQEEQLEVNDTASSFAHSSVLSSYIGVLRTYSSNSPYLNHCVIRMFYRVSVDCHHAGMLFQMSLFRIFQKFHLDPLAKSAQCAVRTHRSTRLRLCIASRRNSCNSRRGYCASSLSQRTNIRVCMLNCSSGRIERCWLMCSMTIRMCLVRTTRRSKTSSAIDRHLERCPH